MRVAEDRKDIVEYCKRFDRVFCYGAGYYGRILRVYSDENNISLDGFVTSEKPSKKVILGLPVYSVNDIFEKSEKCGIILGVGIKNQNDISVLLEGMGIDDYLVIENEFLKSLVEITSFQNAYSDDNDPCILLYHRVCELDTDIWSLAIKPHLFEEHVRFLSENYSIIGLEDDWNTTEKPPVIITFDDGYFDNYLYALPILEKYRAPATIFVSTGNIDSKKEFWWDALERIIYRNKNLPKSIEWNGNSELSETMEEKKILCYKIRLDLLKEPPNIIDMRIKELAGRYSVFLDGHTENRTVTSEELKKLSESPYITIGAHTVTHSRIASEDPDLQKWEISESKRCLESITGKRIKSFSYPFGQKGDYTEDTVRIAKEEGIEIIASAIGGMAHKNEPRINISRNGVGTTMETGELNRMIRMTRVLKG